MSLSANQLADMQGDLGISSDETVFTDDELNRLYTRADSDYATAVYMGFRQLLAQSSKLHDYAAAQTRMTLSQVFDHVKAMAEFWQAEARGAGNQVQIMGITEIPPRFKDEPDQPKSRPSTWKWDYPRR